MKQKNIIPSVHWMALLADHHASAAAEHLT